MNPFKKSQIFNFIKRISLKTKIYMYCTRTHRSFFAIFIVSTKSLHTADISGLTSEIHIFLQINHRFTQLKNN